MRDFYSLEDAITATDFRTERPFRCHAHNDSKASASVNMIKGVWVCYTCGAHGSVEDDIILDGDRIYNDVLALLEEVEPASERMMDFYCVGDVHPYWLTRFSESTARHFQLGYDRASGQPCYPMRYPDKRLAGIVRRNLSTEGPKYLYPRGFTKSNFLFNYDSEHRSVVVLVEGAMDVCAAWEVGYDCFGIYGSTLSWAQATLLQKVAPDLIVTAFDNDNAGRKAAVQVREMCSDWTFVKQFPWERYEQYNDIAEMPVTTRSRSLDAVAS